MPTNPPLWFARRVGEAKQFTFGTEGFGLSMSLESQGIGEIRDLNCSKTTVATVDIEHKHKRNNLVQHDGRHLLTLSDGITFRQLI